MHSAWTPQDWAIFLAALAAALVSVIDAIKGHLDRLQLQKTINQVKAKQAEK